MQPIEITWPDGTKQTTSRPWAKRTEELAEAQGAYADYAAWIEWIEKQAPGIVVALEVAEAAIPLNAYLYSVCCSLANGDAKP